MNEWIRDKKIETTNSGWILECDHGIKIFVNHKMTRFLEINDDIRDISDYDVMKRCIKIIRRWVR